MTTPDIVLFAAGADVNVDFDLSFLAQVALFGLFCVVLKPILFDPLLKLFEERERQTEGARASARKMDERAADLLQQFEAEIEQVRREATAERDRLRADSAALEARINDESKAEAARILADGRVKIAEEVAALRKELAANQPALARQIASKLLGREVSQ